jgi:23S rRNA (adenine(2503)-C(2))-methyltransferase
MDLEKLEKFLVENGQPKFRLGQIQKAIFQDGGSSFLEISTISKDLREKMEKEMQMLSFEVEKVLVAKDNQSIKALLKLSDGNLMETVLISPKPNVWSACISCQVGCAMGCRFCATGKMGFKRNLTAEEITDQILFWKQYLKARSQKLKAVNTVANIVYMGMGEPFLNWKEVSASIKNLTDKKLFGFGSRSLSVSTAGIAEGIEKMAKEFPQVNLAISLHFASDEKRNDHMPVNKKDDLESLKNALQKYFQITKRKVFLEYIMLSGINDSAEDVKMLTDYIYSIGNLHLLHVNLIRYNITSESFKPSSKNKMMFFKAELAKRRIGVTIRKSLGEEIQGACGQLAAN